MSNVNHRECGMTIIMGFNTLSRENSRVILAMASAFNGRRQSTFSTRVNGVRDGWGSYKHVLGKHGRVFKFPDTEKASKFLNCLSSLDIPRDFQAVVQHQHRHIKHPTFA